MRRFRIDPSEMEAAVAAAAEDSGKPGPDLPPGAVVALSPGDANHVRNVLRLKPGALVRLFDGRGREYDARISAVSAAGVQVSVTGQIDPDTESPAAITIAQGFLKEKKMDELIRPLTELGISRWIPFIAERSVARPDALRLPARKARWEKIAAESLKQCRRSRVPEIGEVLTFGEMLHAAAGQDLKILFWEKTSGPARDLFSLAGDEPCETVFAVLGPEGGLSEEEVAAARDAGFVIAALGPRILRAETATVAATALLQYFLGDLGKNP